MVNNLWSNQVVEEIAISKFKATCLSVLERVRKTCKPILVTRYGKPFAQIIPHSPRARWLGCMAGTVEIVGDIVGPAADDDEWNVLGDNRA